jgi:riboflavin synthase
MFTGIIESVGVVKEKRNEGSNVVFRIESSIAQELKVDQSLAHDGVCLTVVSIQENEYEVVAIDETLRRTNLSTWLPGRLINLERAMKPSGRLDGHMVQGHVDTIARCSSIREVQGSWEMVFKLDTMEFENLMVDKGSISINGISLTLVHTGKDYFSVAIIPYTYEHTNMQQLREGDVVNIEFDILGKYIQKNLAAFQESFLSRQV